MNVTTLSDIGNIPIGTVYNLNKPINIILGRNGVGKTTLLRHILCKFTRDWYIKPYDMTSISPAKVDLSECKYTEEDVTWFMSESNEKFRPSLDGLDRGQLSCIGSSSGQSSTLQVINAVNKGKLVILDEPESSLDLYHLLFVAQLIACRKDSKIILVTHNKALLDCLNQVNPDYIQYLDIKTGKPLALNAYYTELEKDLNHKVQSLFKQEDKLYNIKPEILRIN